MRGTALELAFYCIYKKEEHAASERGVRRGEERRRNNACRYEHTGGLVHLRESLLRTWRTRFRNNGFGSSDYYIRK